MLIVCPNCAARYEVAALALPAQGREVECTACGHVWLYLPPPDARRAVPAGADADSAPPDAAAAAPGTASDASGPMPETGSEPETEPETESESESGPDFALSPIEARLPPEVLALLREEAARELAARRGEAGHENTQIAETPGAEAPGDEAPEDDAPGDEAPGLRPEGGADVPPAPAGSPGDASPVARGPNPAPAPAPGAAPGDAPRPTGHDAPDPDTRDEENEVAQAVPPAPPAPVWPVEAEPAPLWTPAPAPSEGPAGLALVGALGLLALSIAALIYVGAPALGRAVPSLGPILSVYVDAADWILAGLRGWILALPTRLSGGGG